MGAYAKKAEKKKQAEKSRKKKRGGWARFCRIVKILDSRWFAAVLTILWSAAVGERSRSEN